MGVYQQTWPSAAEPLLLRLRLSQSFWGSVRGTIHFGAAIGGDPGTPVRGRYLLSRVSISRDLHAPVPATVEELTFTRREPADSAAPPVSPRAPEFPSHFECRLEDSEELSGTWRTITTWMVGTNRKIVPVVLAEGTWTVRRTAGDA